MATISLADHIHMRHFCGRFDHGMFFLLHTKSSFPLVACGSRLHNSQCALDLIAYSTALHASFAVHKAWQSVRSPLKPGTSTNQLRGLCDGDVPRQAPDP
jgi:hypothetical protein